ncbi:MAG: MFS transporter, partial [Gemmatimonadales bacterium]
MGPLLLGRLFDTVGRRPMIAGTYLLSAVMLGGVAVLFGGCAPTSCQGQFTDWELTLALAGTFFFASAGASSAYLTVSEVFPMEIRALAIAFFYAIGTAIGGITGPQVFEHLGSADTNGVVTAYLIGAAVMAFGGVVELFLGVRAEQRRLEDIAKPITAAEAEREEAAERPAAEDEAERRHRARADRERRGLRRYRPGPGTASFSPFFGQPPEQRQEWLDNEVEIITRALQEHGELGRDELARRIGARYWGPGRFRPALREALSEGRIRRVSRSRYAIAEARTEDPEGPAQPAPA